jgi:FixJ family two-component response regulator
LTKSNKLIAVVDDDPDMLRAIVRLLKAHGFDVHAFASAEAFLDGDAGRVASCLILDIHLGGMSGIELQRHLSARGSGLPIIFITAMDDAATRHEAMDAGCVAYLCKPFVAKLLLDAIHKAAV